MYTYCRFRCATVCYGYINFEITVITRTSFSREKNNLSTAIGFSCISSSSFYSAQDNITLGQGLINQLNVQWLCRLAWDDSFTPKIQISSTEILNFVENLFKIMSSLSRWRFNSLLCPGPQICGPGSTWGQHLFDVTIK